MGLLSDRIIEFIDTELRNQRGELSAQQEFEELEEVIDNLQTRIDAAREAGEID